MKLHTDFHDYYDFAVGYGIDEKVHYNRFTKEVEIIIKSGSDFPNFRGLYLLGFCGQVYPLMELEKYKKNYDYCYDTEDCEVLERYFVYSFEQLELIEREWDGFYGNFGYYEREKIQLKQFFIDWSYQSNNIFLKYKAPTWIIKLQRNGNTGTLNPKLKDYGFERIKDAFAAFQEISMYLSNILVEQKETVVIEDKFKIEQHGFDLKKSFRKDKKNK